MAITAAGVGSGIDIETIVSQLMTLERQPLDRLESRESVTNAQLSAYGQIKSALSSFQDAMSDLSSIDEFKIYSSTSSDEDVLTAETDESAASGIYNLTIDQLAQNHKLGSAEFADTDTIGGGGVDDKLTLTVGTESMDVDLSTAKTLTEIRDAINSDENNPGVTATILNTGGGNQRLVLTSNESGYENRVQLSYGGTIDANTLNLATTNQDSDGVTLTDLADLDAVFSIDGFSLTSSSNNVSGVMDGITFDLKQTGSVTLNIERDTESIEASAQAFVDAYNAVLSTINTQRNGQLSGDSSLRSIEGLMRNVLNTAPSGLSGIFSSLSEVGIKTNAETGRLELDSSDFSEALNADFDSVAQLFANDDQGFAFRFEALAESLLDTDGLIDAREDGLRDRISTLQDQQADYERRLELKEKALRSQYAALDSLVGSLQTTSDFLTQNLS